jgi:hypothetical protein
MGEARPCGYVRNTLPRPIRLPLADGRLRYLGPCDTTAVDPETRNSPPVLAALAAGVLAVVVLPGFRMKRDSALALRSPVSASTRHFLAIQAGMARMVEARMAQERAAGAAVLYNSKRWTRQTWRADRAWAKAGEYRAKRAKLSIVSGKRAAADYRSLKTAAATERLPHAILLQLLDGEQPTPPQINGVEVLMRSETESRTADRHLQAVLRHNRRCWTARRLLAAARDATGETDAATAAAWLIATAARYLVERLAA